MKHLISILGIAMAIGFTTTALAQAPVPTPGIIVANINLSNITIVSQTPTEIVIALDIVNNGDTTHSDIKYGVELVKKSSTGQSIADTYTAPLTLTVPAKQTLHQEFTYPVPATLSGAYDLWVISRATSGMMLGLGSTGSVTLTGATEYIEIAPETCYASVGSEATHYNLLQGVDVKSEETLSLACTATNNFARSINVTPSFETYERSTYGTPVVMSYPVPTDITFSPNEKKTLSVTIPKPTKAQAYDVTMSLTEKGKPTPVSGSITLHYVVSGASATIQNASLDKTTYAKGDTITATLHWSPSADQFPNARLSKSGTAVSPTVQMTITDASGVSCATPFTQKLPPTQTNITLTAPATGDCVNPQAIITLTGDNGKVFDARTFGNGTNEKVVTPVMEKDSLTDRFSKNTLLVAGVLGALLMAIVLLWRKRGVSSGTMMKSLFLALMVSSGFLVGVGKAEAVSVTAYSCCGTITYTVSTDESIYTAGETITLPESAYFPSCGNAHTVTYIATLNGVSVTSYTTSGQSGINAYLPIAASTPPGSYNVEVVAYFDDSNGSYQAYTIILLPITILGSNTPPTASITVPSSNITVNQNTATTMTGSGSDPDSGDSITAYEWRESSCSAGALISTISSFSLTNPVAGVRNIYLRVKDANNAWSTNCPSRQITVSTCSAVAGTACASPANACGGTNTGTVQCDGSCSAAIAPPTPLLYGQSCVSAANICGQTNTGTYTCTSTCGANAPHDDECPAPTCGNGICEGWSASPETPVSCPADCKVKVKQF